MAGRKIGVVSIALNAGTAEFISKMDEAGAKIQNFGRQARSGTVETTAFLRGIEGNLANNNRAIARFLSNTLGLGPVLAAAFPVVGVVAFGAMIVETGKKVVEFFNKISQAPERIAGEFRKINAPIRLTNDELRVANDRLQNEIAKLEGKHENGVKLALDEAIKAADKLADSLNNDLDALNKLLKSEEIGFWKKLTGQAGTSDITKEFGGETGFGGFAGKVAGEKDPTKLLKLYADELTKVNALLKAAKDLETQRTTIVAKPVPKQPSGGSGFVSKEFVDSVRAAGPAIADQRARIELLTKAAENLSAEMEHVRLETENAALTKRKDVDEAAKVNAKDPFTDRMTALNAKLQEVRANYDAIGKTEAERAQAKGVSEAIAAIEHINTSLKDQHKALIDINDARGKQVQSVTADIARVELASQWKQKIDEITKKIGDQIREQSLLNAAIDGGYEAVKRAAVETQVMRDVGAEMYNDQTQAAQVALVRRLAEIEYDRQHTEQSQKRAKDLSREAELQQSLTAVQHLGADAIERVTLAYKLRAMVHAGVTAAEIKAEIALFEATHGRADEAERTKLDRQLQGIKLVTDAQTRGLAAVQEAKMKAKAVEMTGQDQSVIDMEMAKMRAQYEEQIATKVVQIARGRENERESIKQEMDMLDQMYKQGQITEEELRRGRKSGAQRTADTLIADAMERGNGVRAFFLEMQKQSRAFSEDIAQNMYRTMTSALDQLSDQFAKFFTGQKTSFKKMFQGLGEELLKGDIKAALTAGLAQLSKIHIGGAGGGVLGTSVGSKGGAQATIGGVGGAIGKIGQALGLGASGKPDGSREKPFYVVMEKLGSVSSASKGSIPGLSDLGDLTGVGLGGATSGVQIGKGGSGGAGGGLLGALGSLASAFGGGLASGGPVSPDQAYLVGENGPEVLIGASGRIASNSESRRTFGGNASNHYYSIDARGANEAAIEARVRSAIIGAHDSAVGTSVRVQADRLRRVPQHSGGPANMAGH